MVVLRCTQQLLKRLGHAAPSAVPESTTRLGDWYGTTFLAGRRRYGLFISEHSRLPVVLDAHELKEVPTALPARVRLLLEAIGVDARAADEELAQMRDAVFAGTRSRSLIGSMNDFVSMARAWLEGRRIPAMLELSLDLAGIPVGPLKETFPFRATLGLFGVSGDAEIPDPTLGRIELVVVTTWLRTALCRRVDNGQTVHLRAARFWELVPGEVAMVRPFRTWVDGARTYVSGAVEARRIDATALGVTPLRMESRGVWDPVEEYWGEDGDPIDEWAKPIIARGPRPCFEMEQVLPGWDPDDPDEDPICRSIDCKHAGDHVQAREILMDLCEADVRCLDAHAHLGNLAFDFDAVTALHHYDVGVRIGELSLGESFDGVLSWGWIDNRPFLRCLSGYGLCLWRQGRFDEAAAVFERLLWLSPSDNQGVRFLLDPVRRHEAWRPE